MNALLVIAGENFKNITRDYLENKINEFKSLVRTLNWRVVDILTINLREISPAFYITPGKLTELKLNPQMFESDCIVFYNDLTPVQIRNLEKELGKRIFTKVDIILMIFKEHAVSSEAKLQVELATLQIELPRLTGIGKEMEQIKGGIGLRGPGERQTEIIKRHIKERIRILKRKLAEIKKNRKIQMKLRKNSFNICIVGYTNSGKSSLMNLLTKANVIEENKLFSTLDTKTKKLYLDGVLITITDTVGFIEDLPHQLIESFYSTLEVVKKADLLLHVVDISSKFFKEKINVVNDVIEQILNLDNLPKPEVLYVFNKVDLVEDLKTIEEASKLYPEGIIISVKRKINIDKLKEKLKKAAIEFYRKQNNPLYSKIINSKINLDDI